MSTTAVAADRAGAAMGGPATGFGTQFRKELREWIRSHRGAAVLLSAMSIGAFTVVIPFIVKAADTMGTAPEMSMDPTVNVLLGWGTGTVAFVTFIVVLSTIGLMTGERDRGTLAWALTNPVSRPAILLAKWAAAMVALGVFTIVVPLAMQVVIATVAYGSVPDIALVAGFGALYLIVPAFWLAVTIAGGTVISSTAGVAGIGLFVMFLPGIVGTVMPSLNAISPTNLHLWAHAVATGGPVDWSMPLVTAAAVALLAAAAIVAFQRQDV
jgi:ABC-2 type transport system permease protein